MHIDTLASAATQHEKRLRSDPQSVENTMSGRVLLIASCERYFALLEDLISTPPERMLRARSAREAYAYLRREQPNGIILHARLPDESGWLAASKMLLQQPDLPVWIFAPELPPGVIAFARSLGVARVITAP